MTGGRISIHSIFRKILPKVSRSAPDHTEQPSGDHLIKYPACAVYCKALNLLKQVGFLPGKSALAEAYRFIVARSVPFLWVLAQNGSAVSRTQQGT